MTTQPTAQQLDIFADSRDVVLRNGVLDQLQRRDGAAARAALEEPAAEYPGDGALSAMTVLVRELEGGSTTPFADHAALAIARRHHENEVVPAVGRVLPRRTYNGGSRRAGARSRSGPQPWRFAGPRPGIVPKITLRRCGFARANGRLREQRSKPLSRGGGSRHRSHG
ncbi:hypothetical protein PPGU19_061510 (plasmid) [Paraburkholderia sp. PGU19]|uniref:hypothetical protein n=1 Tax=Paraburkholderia sp. PGU19 TaxID=2735434 RepID=UPI0015DD0A4B|nr:hypothetical protein [Paraburkholderia sp. PGU19]BCG01583.1 hypothetical protein PPGU19_061510 [Paraburkholderia sp. PGU19]